MHNKSEKKTLLMSVVMSAPGPLIIAAGLLNGQSSTQVADFVRRSAELLGIIMAYAVYVITTKDGACDKVQKERWEKFSNIFVGVMMCIGGMLMLGLAFTTSDLEKGNVIPGLLIALLGLVANTLFWRKYTKLNQTEPNAIIVVQARLYRAKSFVDGCVSIALGSVAIFPHSMGAYYLDFCGTVVVAVYLSWCGIKTIMERVNQ